MERRDKLYADPQPGSLSEKATLGEGSSRRVGGSGLERPRGTENVLGSTVPTNSPVYLEPGNVILEIGSLHIQSS